MELVNDLGKEIAFAVLVEKKYREKIEKQEVLPLISKVTEVLKTVSTKDHVKTDTTSAMISANPQ